MVTLLRPGVGKEDEDLLQPLRGDLLPEHLDRIVADDAHVRERARLEAEQHPPDSRAMHLDAQEIPARISGGEGEQVLAVAEADLEGTRRLAPERRERLERARGEFDPESRPQLGERTLLCRRDAPGAGHERADRARVFDPGHASP